TCRAETGRTRKLRKKRLSSHVGKGGPVPGRRTREDSMRGLNRFLLAGLVSCCAAAIAVASCESAKINRGSGGNGGGRGAGGGAGGAGGSGGPAGRDGGADAPVCGEQTFMLERVPPKVLIVLDRSGSMGWPATTGTRWSNVTAAINTVVMSLQAVIEWGISS